uniref:Glycosyltransferase family 1 protein n=1 Tax=Oscillatoriales cyanobacterium SpSt-402 TaxID=2282168 RepID=A0A832H3Q2_9CYAN
MSKPPRFLYVANHAGHFILHHLPIVKAVKEAGFEVHIAAPGEPDSLERVMVPDARHLIEGMGFPFHPVTIKRGQVNLTEEVAALYSLYSLYRFLRPDLVYHATIKPVIYGGIISRLTGVPAAINAVTGLGHTFLSSGKRALLLKQLVKLAYRSALGHHNSRVIFQNPDDYRLFVDTGIVEQKRASVIYGSGVNINEFGYSPESDSQPPVVLLASRMLWSKGVGEFVEASAKLQGEGIKARFVLVGDSDPGNPETISRQQLQTWHHSGLVEWWGWRRDMPNVFRQSAVFCLPSFYPEGIPKVLLEAASSGRPIITTATPGCREVVRDNENGLLIPPHDVGALANAIQKLLEDPELRQEMGSRSREIAEREFREEVVTETIVDLCRRLLSEANLEASDKQSDR